MSSERSPVAVSSRDTDDIAVSVENLSKCYHIYPGNKARLRQIFLPKRKYYQEFWALRDINFEIPRGEMFGIIGPNGAGKSTLLQILAGILRPTSGIVDVRGRVTALLELGAGFNPQYTGRENAYMNGAIMGLSRKEMEKKIGAIRDFADIGDFFDRPVWMYSTGMYMRLAFAVVTTLEPDILVIDEVLAVGDHEFQKKCLKRMRVLIDARVTILFVSHNLDTVRYYCKNCILLHHGQLLKCASSEEAVEAYYKEILFEEDITEDQQEIQEETESVEKRPSHEAVITGVKFLDSSGNRKEIFTTGEKITIRIEYMAHERVSLPSITFGLYDADDRVVCAHTTHFDKYIIEYLEGSGYVDLCVDQLVLLDGYYRASVSISDMDGLSKYDWHQKKYDFKVVSGGEQVMGLVYLPHHWEFSPNIRYRR